jgi:membrane-associated protein
MEIIKQLFHYLMHVDQYLIAFVSLYGTWTYAVLFLIIFCETGLIVTPFLPGDSLLFAAGSIASHDSQPLNIQLLFLLSVIASTLGNKVNYLIGRMIGPRIFIQNDQTPSSQKRSNYFINPKHLKDAHQFYEHHGGKTIIIARFIPIFRTFVPFVAGICAMNVRQFSVYNILSSLLWIGSLLASGYYFGNLPQVRENFSLAIYAVIAFSFMPPLLIYCYRKLFPSPK